MFVVCVIKHCSFTGIWLPNFTYLREATG